MPQCFKCICRSSSYFFRHTRRELLSSQTLEEPGRNRPSPRTSGLLRGGFFSKAKFICWATQIRKSFRRLRIYFSMVAIDNIPNRARSIHRSRSTYRIHREPEVLIGFTPQLAPEGQPEKNQIPFTAASIDWPRISKLRTVGVEEHIERVSTDCMATKFTFTSPVQHRQKHKKFEFSSPADDASPARSECFSMMMLSIDPIELKISMPSSTPSIHYMSFSCPPPGNAI